MSALTVHGLVLAAALAASTSAAQVPAPNERPSERSPLWGQLEPGPYAVGFRQLLLRDVSRPALAREDGAAAMPGRGRQMQIAVWYPARRTTRQPMRYGEYIDRLGQELDFGELTAAVRQRAIQKFMEMPGGLGGDTAALARGLTRVRSLSTAAYVNAPPSGGRFPLVLFPDYRAPASNSVLAEYLASHGYVVASPTLKGTFDATPETSARGLETLAADLRFVIAALDSFPFIDHDRVAAMGVGIAASGALALQMRTPALRALVSLEGGITTAFEIGLIAATPYFDIAAVRVPILAITAPHPSVDASRLDIYRYATRHIVHFPHMGEFWFLNFGPLEREVPRIIGVPPGDVSAGFEWGARWVRLFLDGYLRNDTGALTMLANNRPPAGARDSVFTVAVRAGLPAPPSIAALKQLVLRDGARALATLIDQRRAADSQPIPNDYLAALASWLGNSGRDPSGNTRHEIAVLRATMYPRSARARFSLGMSATARRDSTLARTHLAETLRLLSDDADPALDRATRARIETQARDALARLGAR